MTDSQKAGLEVAVVGDGWAALGAVGFLAAAGKPVCWISGTGARLVPPLPSLEAGPGVQVWSELARRLGVDAGEYRTGSFLREFRNKGFREAPWFKAPTPAARAEVREEILWTPETRIAGAFEARFELNLGCLEDGVRQAVAALPGVRRIEGNPVTATKFEDGRLRSLVLGSGEEIAVESAIYGDRWSVLGAIDGLPKALPFARNREPMGVLQATLTHAQPVPAAAEIQEGFFSALHKEAGDEFPRHVFGYFTDGGRRSHWTLLLAPSEVEDNHEIAKKFRRMKQALDRMFTGADWVTEGKADFMATVAEEQVRFEESVIFGAGKAPEAAIHVAKHAGIAFLTDGYGPSSALHQVGMLLGEELGISLAAAVEPEAGVESVAAVDAGAAVDADGAAGAGPGLPSVAEDATKAADDAPAISDEA